MELGTILATLSTILNAVVTTVKGGVETAKYTQTTSLSDITKLTRVEPLTIISKDLINLEYMPEVANSLLSLFCGYYLQAVSLLTKVNDVEVIRILDKLNPDRDYTGLLLANNVGQESIRNLLVENYKYSLPTGKKIALEDDRKNLVETDLNEITNLSVGKMLNIEISFSKDTVCQTITTKTGSLTEPTKDSMGNLTSPVIVPEGSNSGEKTTTVGQARNVKVPVSVRLLASIIPNASIAHILTYHSDDQSIVERFHAWRGGRISFIKDLIFCQDLIDEYKRATIGDETNTLQEIIRRVNNSKTFGLLSANPSLVSASNIFIISETVAKEIEFKLGGKLKDLRTREKAFENTYAMIIAVVDREWERVTFYSRGVNAATDVSIKEIKAANKGKGPDIMDIMKSYNSGLPPSF